MRKRLTLLALFLLAGTGYSQTQQVFRDDGVQVLTDDGYIPWRFPADEVKADVPMRYFYEAGDPIPEQELQVIHQKDQSIFGWKFTNEEWELLINGLNERPSYYYDENRHESNSGTTTV